MNNCRDCKKDFVHSRSSGSRTDLCNTCRTSIKRKKKRKILLTMAGNKCIQCGYEKCREALHFHHTNPDTKSFTVSSALNRSMNELVKEINKCILVCANCHTEIHARLM